MATSGGGLEVWENPNQCWVYVVGIDHRGNNQDKPVAPGRRINLTPEEREYNESLSASDALNPFRNGLLRPIRLPEGHDFTPAVVTENAKSDDELREMLKKSGAAFTNSLKAIDSAVTLTRLSAIADEHGTVKQAEAVKVRLEEVAPPIKTVDINSSLPKDQRANFM